MASSSSLGFTSLHQNQYLFSVHSLSKCPSPTGARRIRSRKLLSPSFPVSYRDDLLPTSAFPGQVHASKMVDKMGQREVTHVERSMSENHRHSSGRVLGGRMSGIFEVNGGNDMVVNDGVGASECRSRGYKTNNVRYRRNRDSGSSGYAVDRSKNDETDKREDGYVKRSSGSKEMGELRDRSSSGRVLGGKRSRKFRKDGRNGMVAENGVEESEIRNHGHIPKDTGYRRIKELGSSGISSVKSKNVMTGKNTVVEVRNREKIRNVKSGKEKTNSNKLVEEAKMESKCKKSKGNTPEFELKVGLDMCSKKGDVMGAIALYDSAMKENIKLDQYHCNVLLYLCSSAATGIIQPGKSGSISSSSNNSSCDENGPRSKTSGIDSDSASEEDCYNDFLSTAMGHANEDRDNIHVSENVKKYALTRGFEIYEKICSEGIPLSEAALTSVARMAMSMGNGDLAFDIVKKIKTLGLTLRLRSYGPALFTFCNNDNIDKAFEVEHYMLESNVCPEEPELAALLKVSVGARRSDKVYYLLQKLRTTVRQVSPSTAELIESWFKSSSASKVGKRKWDIQLIEEAMENGGGGWHGLGWLGKGKWSVAQSEVDEHGFCLVCGEKLVAIDIDPVEAENFSKSVATIAAKREKQSNFEKFQRWLDYYGPFEAVIDAANVGLFSQRRFSVHKVNAVVNAIRQKLPSKKCPLVVVHNRRIYGGNMVDPTNMKLIEKWKNADAFYATPTGSNDDWYWLYAAVKCKALIVTNDEMRDHIFQVLGNDFFPKWKERHQVHFNFGAGGPEFYMPPACSVVIQESQHGHWHIPILSENKVESGICQPWLCVTRATSSFSSREVSSPPEGTTTCQRKKAPSAGSIAKTSIRETTLNKTQQLGSIVNALEAAERTSGTTISFEI